ncbi:MAG: CIA30 family protein [Deltaproteobacteria bacterium]|nr:CIA30 family protein [Deltaproteobacteria bacterium]
MTDYDIEVFYDGACPLCMREVRWLRRRDQQKRIRFVDIAASGFDVREAGVSREALMDRIHGRLPDGTIIEGVEVFRRLYASVGFPFLSRISRLPGITEMLDLGYSWFARNRLRLTRRCRNGICEIPPIPEGAGTEEPPTAVSFGQGALRWFYIGDPIMGGVSNGVMEIAEGVGVFRGAVSLERGGGFASVRSEEGRFDLSGFTGLLVRARGDGRRYGLRLRSSAGFDGVNYHADFHPEAGVWTDVRIPFPDFRPVFRGQPVAESPPLDTADIRTFGLIIAGRQAGPFRLELKSIRGYRDLPA